MKKILGNEIKWYKPFALIRRNKELERLTETQFMIINDLNEEIRKLKMMDIDRHIPHID